MTDVSEQREIAAQGAKELRLYWKLFLAFGAGASGMVIIPGLTSQHLWMQAVLLIFAGVCVWISAKCHTDAKKMSLLAH